jgi:hypothetical protein
LNAPPGREAARAGERFQQRPEEDEKQQGLKGADQDPGRIVEGDANRALEDQPGIAKDLHGLRS